MKKLDTVFLYEWQYFELDLYSETQFWKDQAILEIELTEENDNIKFPDFLEIISDVTQDYKYKNRELAKDF